MTAEFARPAAAPQRHAASYAAGVSATLQANALVNGACHDNIVFCSFEQPSKWTCCSRSCPPCSPAVTFFSHNSTASPGRCAAPPDPVHRRLPAQVMRPACPIRPSDGRGRRHSDDHDDRSRSPSSPDSTGGVLVGRGMPAPSRGRVGSHGLAEAARNAVPDQTAAIPW